MNPPQPRKLIIAIDGPAGVGKSTIASRLARKLGYANLESGAMYRALALKAIEWDASFDDEATLAKLAHDSRIQMEPASNGTRVLLDGRDVTQRVRDTDVTAGASRVSVHPKVREWMVARQQELGTGGGVVMEGRDIGTKVFPNADVKIFLDADPVVREQRRLQQQNLRGTAAQATAAELRERDRRDRTRAASPLAPAARRSDDRFHQPLRRRSAAPGRRGSAEETSALINGKRASRPSSVGAGVIARALCIV